MKQLYLVLFFLVCSFGFSQNQTKGDIEGFKLYPNPVTNGKIFISTAQNAPKQIHVFDVLGTKVLETTILGKELNLSNLDKGVYILRVLEKDKMATRKLVIK
ncbi:T9SS type A sorting domain-containing protein [Croceitalea sp. MTPC9]|uniref:T9SS type A sorting domain-containing protein n=1 Tax=unclassified Croceitalea TaxID=2632280 RepID=UPI002B3D06F1|nr:T9SS type A sorting domain-containing protein [Croceitalea sp. MTPC6]GMN16960.1 T9SS type A sorting domain-containing protein [Croceitalea sp. MTPC9]